MKSEISEAELKTSECDLVFLRDHPPSKPASRESGNQRVATEVVKFWKSARVGTENQRVVIRCFCVITLPHKCGRRCRGCHRQSRQVARAHRVRQPRAPSPPPVAVLSAVYGENPEHTDQAAAGRAARLRSSSVLPQRQPRHTTRGAARTTAQRQSGGHARRSLRKFARL